ncbi:MAG: bifunctional hydroxymethylpyrimidine kinase/phosphomethylpyrimidine kinase [Bacteroidetes bacterium]|nr:bifunctional hydroxymethylpyrimidine kinase/phosphomethylpyrimidine kinase [Bacteroidota bacterium]
MQDTYNNIKTLPVVMTIAGSDSGGGAGIQADLKTIATIGGYGTSVITVITAQNTLKVSGIYPIPTNFIRKQFNAIITDFNVSAIKTGMLTDIETIKCVATLIKKSGIKNYVLDPVMVATSGSKLVTEDIVDAIKKKLIPLAKIITPNIPEAEVLLNKKLKTINDMEVFAFELLKLGSEAVLLKGGHLKEDTIIDVFVAKNFQPHKIYKKEKIITKNTHGTGCNLSSALATYLTQNYGWEKTIELAEKYIHNSIYISSNYKIGNGNGPLLQWMP